MEPISVSNTQMSVFLSVLDALVGVPALYAYALSKKRTGEQQCVDEPLDVC